MDLDKTGVLGNKDQAEGVETRCVGALWSIMPPPIPIESLPNVLLMGSRHHLPVLLWVQDLSWSLIFGMFWFSLCRALENKGFEIVKRGEIEVKGKGKMTTYFLIQNLNATEDEIMGRPTVLTHQKGKQSHNTCPQCRVFPH